MHHDIHTPRYLTVHFESRGFTGLRHSLIDRNVHMCLASHQEPTNTRAITVPVLCENLTSFANLFRRSNLLVP
jgi:hypothetical protein